MYTVSGNGYPFVIRGNGEITGEWYCVNSETIEKLDILEGCPEYYTRIAVQVHNNNTWMYIFTQQDLGTIKNLHKIEVGDWIEYNKASNA